MGFKEQINTLKNNWFLFLIAIFLLIVIVLATGFMSNSSFGNGRSFDYVNSVNDGLNYKSLTSNNYEESYSTVETNIRKITRNANLSLEIKKHKFSDIDTKIKNIINNTNSILIENRNSIYNRNYDLHSGTYKIKVESEKLDSVLNQLKLLGKVYSFNISAKDITDQYQDLEIELESEIERLNRYNELYDSNFSEHADKITLIDKIFNQERRIKYLEESLENKDKIIQYSTINLSVSEKSNYTSILFVKFSSLVRTLVGSINVLLYMIFAVVPFIIVIWLIVFLIKLLKKRKKSKK